MQTSYGYSTVKVLILLLMRPVVTLVNKKKESGRRLMEAKVGGTHNTGDSVSSISEKLAKPIEVYVITKVTKVGLPSLRDGKST